MNQLIRVVFFLSLLFLSSAAFSQPWQESLKSAREFYLSKSYDQAIAEYQTAQKLAPKNIDLSLELAQSLYKAGKYAEAEKLFQSQVNKKQEKISNSAIQRQLGDSRMHQQKYEEAIESYKNSLRSNPSDEVARHNLAKAIQKKQEKEKPKDKPNPPNQKDKDPKDKDPKSNDDSKNDPQNNKQAPNNQEPKEREKSENPSLNDKRTERLLEELSQKEKETKRNMNSKRGENPPSKNGVKKDW